MPTSGRTVRIGTRGSPLALRQAAMVAATLEARGCAVELVTIRTTGDIVGAIPVAEMGAVGVFTNELDRQLLEDGVDLAVHSLKDLPTTLPMGIVVAAVGEREDPRDALVGRGPLRWAELPLGATIATSSPRRRAQLLRARPDLQVVDIRGNVDTRLATLDESRELAATVLAVAGVARLGLSHRIGERMPPRVMLPAPGQGALAVTARTDDVELRAIVAHAFHDEGTARAVAAERAVLHALGAGCHAPLGTLAEWHAHRGRASLRLATRLCSLDGMATIDATASRDVGTMEDAVALGHAVARDLLAQGGQSLLGGK